MLPRRRRANNFCLVFIRGFGREKFAFGRGRRFLGRLRRTTTEVGVDGRTTTEFEARASLRSLTCYIVVVLHRAFTEYVQPLIMKTDMVRSPLVRCGRCCACERQKKHPRRRRRATTARARDCAARARVVATHPSPPRSPSPPLLSGPPRSAGRDGPSSSSSSSVGDGDERDAVVDIHHHRIDHLTCVPLNISPPRSL